MKTLFDKLLTPLGLRLERTKRGIWRLQETSAVGSVLEEWDYPHGPDEYEVVDAISSYYVAGMESSLERYNSEEFGAHQRLSLVLVPLLQSQGFEVFRFDNNLVLQTASKMLFLRIESEQGGTDYHLWNSPSEVVHKEDDKPRHVTFHSVKDLLRYLNA